MNKTKQCFKKTGGVTAENAGGRRVGEVGSEKRLFAVADDREIIQWNDACGHGCLHGVALRENRLS